jgi:hypothetical protein
LVVVGVRSDEHVTQNVEGDECDNEEDEEDDEDDDENGEWTETSIDKATQQFIVGVVVLLWKLRLINALVQLNSCQSQSMRQFIGLQSACSERGSLNSPCVLLCTHLRCK